MGPEARSPVRGGGEILTCNIRATTGKARRGCNPGLAIVVAGSMALWGVLWRSKNKLDGKQEVIMYNNGIPYLFTTRHEARLFIEEQFGYIRRRPDLQREPHGWQMPVPVKMLVLRADEWGVIWRSK